ncbi:MAG: Cys-tRNA(Pro) deacylase [Saprospiraceae bacterium]|jgi:Cys-tRNA(Pro)/Cys-tRNA(Cys) deacylase|nr:Cys-tRNA(Pro) deacylase [Saprospiraceae bacterium]MDG1434305.1 Cys-tRNA(Pro) deacylase [Saprospiraceae bacterium]
MKKTNALRLLDQRKIIYETVEYEYNEENLSVKKMAGDNFFIADNVFKTLVARGDKNGVLIAVINGNQTLNLKSLAKVSGNKKIALIQVKELLNLTGYIRGGCSPIGMKKNYPVFIDQSTLEFNNIYINAGIRGILVKLNPSDLLKITDGQLVQITDID